MHCEHCAEVVREALAGVDGLSVHDVDVGTAEVAYEAADVDDDRVAAALEEAGYELDA